MTKDDYETVQNRLSNEKPPQEYSMKTLRLVSANNLRRAL